MNLFFIRSATVVAAFSLVTSGFLVAPLGAAHATTPPTQALNVADLTPCCGDLEPDATGFA